MKIYTDTDLSDFDFWSGAIHNAKMLTDDQLDEIGEALERENPDGMSDTEINDLFWFDFEYVCSLAGIKYDPEKDEILDPDDEDEDED